MNYKLLNSVWPFSYFYNLGVQKGLEVKNITDKEIDNFKDAEDRKNYHPNFPEVRKEAMMLGYDGMRNIYNLCAWAAVSSDNCAGPDSEFGKYKAIEKIKEIINRRKSYLNK